MTFVYVPVSRLDKTPVHWWKNWRRGHWGVACKAMTFSYAGTIATTKRPKFQCKECQEAFDKVYPVVSNANENG